MKTVTIKHFERAIEDIGKHGGNDMLPYDIDNQFVIDRKDEIAQILLDVFEDFERSGKNSTKGILNSIQITNERLLSPTGLYGFRISTKIQLFWNVYLNGLSIAIAEKNESFRSPNAHSYRFTEDGSNLFDKERSWRAYKQATLNDPAISDHAAVVIQTDISSFYEHVYHHRIENCIGELFHDSSTIAIQIDRVLNQLSSGRSFGLPVGGQGSRILAELLMTSIDHLLTLSDIVWHRYVDDFTIIAKNQADAYKAISILSNALADYGLSLNRSKTIMLNAKHYANFVDAQLFIGEDDASKLKKIDLYFDPYSDNPQSEYKELATIVEQLDIQKLLELEIHKSQPDAYLIKQISRTLKLQDPIIALRLCKTILAADNLHSFRSSWSTIVKAIISLRSDKKYITIVDELDLLIDEIILHSKHLLIPEANCLYFLKTLRFKRTDNRARYVYKTFQESRSDSIKRGCIECVIKWKDRPFFINIRNSWSTLTPQVQRMLWIASYSFTDDGRHFRAQVKPSISNTWALGLPNDSGDKIIKEYLEWSAQGAQNELS